MKISKTQARFYLTKNVRLNCTYTINEIFNNESTRQQVVLIFFSVDISRVVM